MKRSLEAIGRATGTDKISRHGYHRFYPIFLERLRSEEFAMLEIGTEESKSMRMWEEYFPHARIYGIDIESEAVLERGQIFKGDQSDFDFVADVLAEIGQPLQFIIDDGSHVPEHQLDSFNYLFGTALVPGGVYIIEDIETSYWTKGVLYRNIVKKGYGHPGSIIEIFKHIVDQVNDEFLADKSVLDSSPIPAAIRQEIQLVSFQYNSIVILKKDDSDRPYTDRDYMFAKFL